MTSANAFMPSARFCSPETLKPLEFVSARRALECPGESYPVVDGLPVLLCAGENVEPEVLAGQGYYERVAGEYDRGMDWLFASFHEVESDVRRRILDLLRVEPGHVVLETGCGTCRDSWALAERIGGTGALYCTDLSPSMLGVGAQRLRERGIDFTRHPVNLFVSDATRLPLTAGFFDASYHFGGLNLFSDVAAGIREMVRVVRPGGRVVLGDEGLAPWLRNTEFGRVLLNSNPLYQHVPPLQHLPECARDVGLRWLLGGAFYLIDFTVGEGAPPLDLDLPIPGRRGGTHRTRHYGKLEGVEPALAERARDCAGQAGLSFRDWLESLLRNALDGDEQKRE